jgi:hypothetical protein
MANSTVSTYKWENLNDYTFKKLKCIARTLFYFTIEDDSVNIVLGLLWFTKKRNGSFSLFECHNQSYEPAIWKNAMVELTIM